MNTLFKDISKNARFRSRCTLCKKGLKFIEWFNVFTNKKSECAFSCNYCKPKFKEFEDFYFGKNDILVRIEQPEHEEESPDFDPLLHDLEEYYKMIEENATC